MLTNDEKEKLQKGFTVARFIWIAMLASLGVYMVVCEVMARSGMETIALGPDFPVEVFKMALFGVSLIALIIAFFLRKAMLNPKSSILSPNNPGQHPAVGKYMVAMLISLAISESVGIYGLVLFLLTQDLMPLYQFLIISGAAMIYFRPKFEELENLAIAMKMEIKQG